MFTLDQLKERYNHEQILVILCSRYQFGTETAENIEQFIQRADMDWELFYKLLKSHSISSFVYHLISKLPLSIPDAYRTMIKQEAIRRSMINMHHMTQLVAILRDFEALDIKVIPYKGVSFAAAYYPALGTREGSDIDLLVNKDDVKKIRNYFQGKRFEAKTDVPDGFLNYFLFFFKELVFKTPKDSLQINCSIEVQWKLLDRYHGDFEHYSFFAPHLQRYLYEGRELCKLSPTYELLCVGSNHLIKDHLYSFKYLIDLACLIHRNGKDIDHKLLSDSLEKFGHRGLFYGGLNAIDQLLGIRIDGLANEVAAKGFSLNSPIAFPLIKKTENLGFNGIRGALTYDDKIFSRLKRKMRILAYLLIPNTNDIKVFRLPVYLLPVMFLLKPFRLTYNLITGNKR
ncbi:hypothetical protein PBAL39_05213 [Pedobacter sp. BAL39]|uniref:nucleotidyltransferase family protein n=1 Tax=Pedobacter sp. BAL39 TaxID=391596 RepID=UPI0001559703|nr:nucleotidyltransferase family protein [Pedobacter sp. BAL39]EDM37171.1 hypothetical protein PBAL39_05213 [Pedobacter sp. BAL39]